MKSSENVTCQLGGDEGMNCHSLSEPILSLIHDVPYTTVGKQDSRQIFIQVADKCTHSSFPVHRMFVNSLPEEEKMIDEKKMGSACFYNTSDDRVL